MKNNRLIIIDLSAALILVLHALLLGATASVFLRFRWSVLSALSAVLILFSLLGWYLWGRKAARRGLSGRRARAAVLLPVLSLWVWAGYSITGLMGGRFGPRSALAAGLITLAALAAMAWSLSFRQRTAGKRLLAFAALPAALVLIWALDLASPPRTDVVIRKAAKGKWTSSTSLSGNDRYSNLKVSLNGWCRQSLAIPVNNAMQESVTVPAAGVFKTGVGITRGDLGYQVSAFAVDETRQQHKLGVWYFKRDRSRWEDISADMSALQGRQVRLVLQATDWNPEGGSAKAESSYVFFSNPRVVPAMPPRTPNVIIILADTLRADHLTVYGYGRDTSPFLNSWSKNAIVFENAYSTSSWTMPAIASLFTGKQPGEHGVETFQTLPLPADEETLAELMRSHGWQTAAVFGHPGIGEATGFGQGFDQYAEVPPISSKFGNFEWVGDQAASWLNNAPDTPFFMYIHYLDPHDPYVDQAGLPPWPGKTSRLWKPLVYLTTELYYNNRSDGIMRLNAVRPGLLNALRDRYDREVSAVDGSIGRLMGILKDKGLLNNTIVILVADHGEEFWEHGGLIHGRMLYRECTHIPLIISLPGGAGARVSEPVSLVDVAATVVDAVGGNASLMPGRSLLEGLRKNNIPPDFPVFAELYNVMGLGNTRFRSVIVGNRKLILEETKSGDKRPELYFLDEDPGERRNRAADFPDVVNEMIKLLPETKWPEENLRFMKKIDPEVRKKLEAMGYLK